MKRYNLTTVSVTCMGTHPALDEHPEGFVVHHAEAVALLNAANEKLLDALRREKAALDASERQREFYIKHTAELNAEITRLSNALAEECE